MPQSVVSENSPMIRPRGGSAAQSAQPLAATNVGTLARAGLGRNQLVAESLVVPLSMVVRHELVEGAE
jgi:hypothetical protein